MFALVRSIVVLALPIVLARSTQTIIGLCDALMVAPLGKDALAAATTGALNSYSLMMFPTGLVFIVQSFAAQLTGRNDPAGARRFGVYGLGIAAVFGALAIACIPVVRVVLGLFDYAPAVAEKMGDYITIRLLGIGAIVGTEVLGNWYAGVGRPMRQMIAGIIAMVLNVLGCWLLISGHWGFPALGVRGSAWAATIGSGAGFAYLLGAFLLERGRVGTLTLREVRRFLQFGVPNGFNWFLEFAAFAIFINVMIAHLGTAALAGTNTVLQINGVAFMPTFALASSGAVLVGQAIGAGERDRVPAIVRATAVVGAAWMGTVGIVYLLFAPQIFSQFAPAENDALLLATGALVLRLASGWQLFDAVAMIFGEALRGAGDTRWCMWARIVLAWPVFLPLSYLLVFRLHGGLVAAIVSIIVYLALLAALFVWRFQTGAWRKIDLVEPVLVE